MESQLPQTSAPLMLIQMHEEGRIVKQLSLKAQPNFILSEKSFSLGREQERQERKKSRRGPAGSAGEEPYRVLTTELEKFWSRRLLPCLFQSHTPLHLLPLCLQQLNDRHEELCEEGGSSLPLLTHSCLPLAQNFLTPVLHNFYRKV